jgi:ankyrin repeat protein
LKRKSWIALKRWFSFFDLIKKKKKKRKEKETYLNPAHFITFSEEVGHSFQKAGKYCQPRVLTLAPLFSKMGSLGKATPPPKAANDAEEGKIPLDKQKEKKRNKPKWLANRFCFLCFVLFCFTLFYFVLLYFVLFCWQRGMEERGQGRGDEETSPPKLIEEAEEDEPSNTQEEEELAGETLKAKGIWGAILRGDALSVKEILSKDPDLLSSLDLKSETPLHLACELGFPDVVSTLLGFSKRGELGENVSKNESGKQGKENLEENEKAAIINQRDLRGRTVLWKACLAENLEIIELLLRDGSIDVNLADQDGITPLFLACQRNAIEVVKALIISHPRRIAIGQANSWGEVPLMIAGAEIASLFLDLVPEQLNAQDHFWVSCQLGRVERVRELLSQPDVNPNLSNLGKGSPLFLACKNGHLAVVKVLAADQRVELNESSPSLSPFVAAHVFGHQEVAAFLARHPRVDVNNRHLGYDRHPPLWMAANLNDLALVRLMLASSSKLDTSWRDWARSRTARERAAAKGHLGVAQLLERYERDSAAVQLEIRRDLGFAGLIAFLLFSCPLFSLFSLFSHFSSCFLLSCFLALILSGL